jgi:hypothetical protein
MNGSLPIGSPNTTTPARIDVALPAIDVAAITGTALPIWSERAETKNATTPPATITAVHGLTTTSMTPFTSPVSAFMATWVTVKSTPAPAPRRTPMRDPWPSRPFWPTMSSAPRPTMATSNPSIGSMP